MGVPCTGSGVHSGAWRSSLGFSVGPGSLVPKRRMKAKVVKRLNLMSRQVGLSHSRCFTWSRWGLENSNSVCPCVLGVAGKDRWEEKLV